MGWTFEHGATRASLIENIKNGRELGQVPVATSISGNHLWCVFPSKESPGDFFIVLCLLAAQKGYGYGYKDMSEDMGPYFYTCPVGWFDKYPTTVEASLRWRESCRRQQRLAKMKPQPGAGFTTHSGDRYTVVGPYCPRGKASPTQSVVRDAHGKTWRMKNADIVGYVGYEEMDQCG